MDNEMRLLTKYGLRAGNTFRGECALNLWACDEFESPAAASSTCRLVIALETATWSGLESPGMNV